MRPPPGSPPVPWTSPALGATRTSPDRRRRAKRVAEISRLGRSSAFQHDRPNATATPTAGRPRWRQRRVHHRRRLQLTVAGRPGASSYSIRPLHRRPRPVRRRSSVSGSNVNGATLTVPPRPPSKTWIGPPSPWDPAPPLVTSVGYGTYVRLDRRADRHWQKWRSVTRSGGRPNAALAAWSTAAAVTSAVPTAGITYRDGSERAAAWRSA